MAKSVLSSVASGGIGTVMRAVSTIVIAASLVLASLVFGG